jgi:hypothetical protein
MFDVPVSLLIFNRPELTELVFREIRRVQPVRLFVAADGPRNEAERILCARTRGIIKQIDWDCEVQTLFRDENLGCKKAVSDAIHWFFEQAEEGIILEDDTLPSHSFFHYCRELLEQYRNDERIMHISGENPLDHPVSHDSYYFSKIEHCWGWATWKRAWRHFDIGMHTLDGFIENDILSSIFFTDSQKKYWKDIFVKVKNGAIDSWAYIWTYTIFCNSGLCINSNINLVSNIGFGNTATHTKETFPFSARTSFEIETPLRHPEFIVHSEAALQEILKKRFFIREEKAAAPSLLKKLAQQILMRT